MSLNAALATATSSLASLQKQMAVTSNNIANANTTGYSKESVIVDTRITNGVGSGVTDDGIVSDVDQFLLASVISGTSEAAQASTYYTYYNELQNAFGTVTSSDTGGNDLSSQLASLESDLTSLSNNPEQSSLKTSVISDLDNLTSNLRSTSSTIQDLRSNADEEIASTVDDINTQIETIKELNQKIGTAKAMGQDTAGFEDQRNTALKALSGDIGVSYFVDSNDSMQIYTAGGQSLLVGNTARTLSYTPAGSVNSSTTFSGIMLGGSDITDSLQSGGGTMESLIEMRDVELPAAQSELDNLASTLTTSINTIYNTGTANPATSPVTGTNTTAITDADSVSATAATVTLPSGSTVSSTIRLALVDSSGTTQGYAAVDLSSCSNVLDVRNAIDGATFYDSTGASIGSGLVNATLNSSGQLVLTNVSGSAPYSSCGVSMATESGASLSLNSGTATNVSDAFHLNDLISGNGTAISISVQTKYLNTPSLLSTNTLGTSSATLGLTSGDSSVATALADMLNSTQSFSTAGHLGSLTVTLSTYASDIISDVSTRSSNASDDNDTQSTTLSTLEANLSSQSGVNTDEETANLVTLQSLYAASAKVVSTMQTMFNALLDAVSS